MQQVDNQSLEIGRYAAVLRRRWPVVAIFTLLGLMLSLVYALVAPERVTATTLVSLNLIRADAFDVQKAATELLDPMTEEQLARSSSVAGEAASIIGGGTTIPDVRRNMEVEVVPQTTVLRVSYTAPTLAAATAGSDAIAEAYLSFRGEQAEDKVDRIIGKLQDRRDSLRSQLVTVNAALDRSRPGSPQAVQALSDRQVLDLQLNNLLGQINTAEGVDTSGGDVVTAAGENSVTIEPHKQLLVEVGTAFGLVLGLIAAFVVNALDRRVQEPTGLARAGGGALLARIQDRTAAVRADGRDLDELKSVSEQVLAALPPDEQALTVLDLTRSSNPSDVAANLAQLMAESGRDVELLLPGHSPDFVNRLASGLGVERPGEMPAGSLGPVLSLSSQQPVSDFTGGKVGRERVTLIAPPPRASRSTVLAAARRGRSVVLVVAHRRTSALEVSKTASDLDAIGAHVIGSVMVPRGRSLDLPPDEQARHPATTSASRA